ncbi:MAG: hypothetical protein K6F34_02485 [Lachnospiraceae bacterium]|nr:hypothetical protein [Lachnospiraceae bacterium]
MSKKITSVFVAALLVVSMTVSVFAGSTSSSHAASNAEESSPKKSSPAWNPPPVVDTTPTGQPITDSFVQSLALGVLTDAGTPAAPVSKNTIIAFSKYLKLLLGSNASIVAASKENGAGGVRNLRGPLFFQAFSYTVFAQISNNGAVTVLPVEAKVSANGAISFALPKGTISYCVTCNAVAPR